MNKPHPNNWRSYRFDEIAHNIAKRVEPTETDLDIYVGLEHLDPESLRIKRFGSSKDVIGTKLRVKPGDIIFGRRRAYQRKLAIAEFEGICSAHAMVLRAKESKMFKDFFPFFLQSDMFMERALDISVGSLSPTINWKTLKIQEFSLPPQEEQRKIAELLWAIEDCIRKNENCTQTWRVFKQDLINVLFKIKYHWQLVKNNFKHTGVPDGWKEATLRSVVQFEKGISYSSSNCSEARPGTPFLNIKCVQKGGGLSLDGLKYFTDKHTDEDPVNPGDIIVACTDLTPSGDIIGCPIKVPDLNEDVLVSMDLCKIKFNDNFITSDYLYNFLLSDYARYYMKSRSAGSTVLHLNTKAVLKMKMLLPSISKQNDITKNMNSIDNLLSKIETNIQKLKSLRNYLLNSLLLGKIHLRSNNYV